MSDLAALRTAAAAPRDRGPKARAAIYIFLSGGEGPLSCFFVVRI